MRQRNYLDCSTANKCGSYGYCYEEDDELLCECKFWWEGQYCNHQSSNGKQVIALGCLTAALILTFYGLNVGRKIYLKRKAPKEEKKKDEYDDPKLLNHAFTHMKKSFPLSSIIIAVLLMILAAVALVVKWALLRPIHNDIVNRFKTEQPIYYSRPSFCDAFENDGFNIVTLAVAGALVLVCIIVTERISCMTNKCYGRGAPPMPLDFFAHTDRKFAAVVFAVISNELLEIAAELSGSTDKGLGILVKFLLRVLKVITMGFRFYPILACIHINTMVTLILASLYAWLDFSTSVIVTGTCNPTYYPDYDEYISNASSIEFNFQYFGTGSGLLVVELVTDIPMYLCLAYISIKLPMLVIGKILKLRKRNISVEKQMARLLTRDENNLIKITTTDSVQMRYVRNIFLPDDQRPRSKSIYARIIPRFLYEWRDDFQFSPRVLCVYSSIFLLLYFITIQAVVKVIPIIFSLQDTIQQSVDLLIQSISTLKDQAGQDNADPIKSTWPIPNVVAIYSSAVVMTVTIITIQLVVLLVNIRRNLLQAYRGDDTEIPRRTRKDYVSYATGSFHFAGYFIGYFISGFILIAIFSTIVCALIGSFIQYGSAKALETLLKAIIPSILLVLFKMYLNKVLTQFVFLQHYGDVLALNNRRFYMIFLYFNFFLDAFLGFVSSIVRLIKSLIGGILYMCRLDYSAMGRKLETLDSGFAAYCGFIHTECTHRHPIMLVFVSYLFNALKTKEYIRDEESVTDTPLDEKSAIRKKKSIRYIRKWRLAAFLVRNPSIVFLRKSFLKQLTFDEVRALNDLDNNNRIDTQRTIAFYTHQMAAKRASFAPTSRSSVTIERF
ncbi:unnamed protein product [Adineta steineri]|uniref:EGF-like domain-containing protein n=1 Tax=Adineta steineri TaxID=433720 RepID=A0A818TRV9_9BILA|nr:unnamed protein product [Adineta steineri]